MKVEAEDRGPLPSSVAESRPTTDAVNLRASDPAEVSMQVSERVVQPSGSFDVQIRFAIKASWHLSRLGDELTREGTVLELELPVGVAVLGQWRSPKKVTYDATGAPCFTGEAVFSRTCTVADGVSPGDRTIRCTVAYEACNGRVCQRSGPLLLETPITIELGKAREADSAAVGCQISDRVAPLGRRDI